MTPRADFACLSKKCRTETGEATVYELPTTATRCPVCGSKRVTRLYNAVNVSSGFAKKLDALAEPAVLAARSVQEEQRLAATRYPMVKAVPMRGLGRALTEVYQQNGAPPGVMVNQGDLGRKADLGGRTHPVVSELQGAAVPRQVVARDTEYRVTRTKNADGTVHVDMEKA
jgi:hypothetical protein